MPTKKFDTLRHLHLPGLTSYLNASTIQNRLVRAHLDHKGSPSTSPPPGPILLTFQTPPTYTYGRREIGNVSDSQIEHLRAGGRAEVYEALRGGQTTFHGPGQLIAYLIISLQDHGLNTRSHIRLLENSVIETCRLYSLTTHTTGNPGVWIGSQPDDRKIASVGVHLRRYIASHGISLNVSVDLSWFDRIVACGLVGKRATNIEKERKSLYEDMMSPGHTNQDVPSMPLDITGERAGSSLTLPIPVPVEDVANVFARSVASKLSGVSSQVVESVSEEVLWQEGLRRIRNTSNKGVPQGLAE